MTKPWNARLGLSLTLAAILADVAGFLHLASEVGESETLGFDRALLLALRNPTDPTHPIGSLTFQEAMRDVTALGGFTVLTLLTVLAVIALAFYGRRREAVVFGAVMLLAQVSSDLLKVFYGRPRPDLAPHGSYVYSHSFPSGHAALSAVAFLTLGALLAGLQTRRRAKAFILTVAVLLTVAIGISRVYLAVHWPTDVIGGWALGAAWALLANTVVHAWKRSDAREPLAVQ